MIHELSARGRENFQAVNCAALPDTLFESEIFGYEKGAFTGANDRKPGRVELADRGTLFLDEIGDLSLVAQAKLLRVLEDRRFERLGGQKSIEVNFRLISATNRPLDEFVRDSRFREDLYYRVNAFAIRLPSLRERPVDIPVLAGRFVARLLRGQRAAARREDVLGRSRPEAAQLSMAGQHPRAGKHGIPCGAFRARPRDSRRRHRVPARAHHAGRRCGLSAKPGLPSLRDAERAHIKRVLEAVTWNKKEAARVLEISRGTLYRKIDEYQLEEAKASRDGAPA